VIRTKVRNCRWYICLSLSDNTKEQDYIDALELLTKASIDMDHLIKAVAKFANWWREAKRVIYILEIRLLIEDQRVNPIRLSMARNNWESVRVRYEVYNRTVSVLCLLSDISWLNINLQIDTLTDHYPVDNTSTYAWMLDKVIALFTG
jgi:hypothetical protein